MRKAWLIGPFALLCIAAFFLVRGCMKPDVLGPWTMNSQSVDLNRAYMSESRLALSTDHTYRMLVEHILGVSGTWSLNGSDLTLTPKTLYLEDVVSHKTSDEMPAHMARHTLAPILLRYLSGVDQFGKPIEYGRAVEEMSWPYRLHVKGNALIDNNQAIWMRGNNTIKI